MSNIKLDPEWQNFEALIGSRPLLTGSIDELRQTMAAMESQAPPSTDASISAHDVDIGGGVAVRVYQPADNQDSLPMGIFTHGGGLVMGGLDTEDILCRFLAKYTPCIIVSVGYHLAPEAKVPQQIDDTFAAFEWALKNVNNADHSKIFTIGGSAGGGLSLAVALKLIDQDRAGLLKGVVLLNPVTVHPDAVPEKYSGEYNSYTECGVGMPVVDRQTLDVMFNASEASKHLHDPLVWPLNHPKLSQLPAVYVAACELDPLRDDAVLLSDITASRGVPTRLQQYSGLPHYFWAFPPMKQAAEKFVMDTVGGVHFVLSA